MQEPEGPRGLFDALVYKYVSYARTLSNKCERPYECLITAGRRVGYTRAIYRGREIADIEDAEGFSEDEKPHRLIMMSNTNEAKDYKITVSEIEMLLSWILGGMGAQTHAMCREGVPGSDFHMIFPVLSISFSMPTHARVIQAYFQNDELNIQFTKFHGFSESDFESKYIETMNSLLKWADARPCGDTLAVHGDEKLAEKFRITFDNRKRERAGKSTGALSHF